MASIRKEILRDVPLDTVWDALQDLGALHTRLVPGFVTDTKLEADARTVTFSNGQVVREHIVDVNETEHRVVWAILEALFCHYNASAQVFSEPSGRSRFVWIADLLPKALRDQVAKMMDHGFDAIKMVFTG